jgi:Bacterial protein of unknown function (Gcw_chp)
MSRTAAGLVMAAVVFSSLPAMAQESARYTDTAAARQAAAPAAPAAQPAPDPPAPKPVTLTVGADFPTAYMFRGIFQEDQGFIMQPFVDVGIAAAPGLTINAGLWNSVHSGPSGSDNEDGRGAWYELDFYASATFQVGKVKPGVLYTSYTSPNDAFNTVQEIAAVLAFDDSGNKVPLNPKAILAFELDGQGDGGSSKGTYLELGVRPVFPLAAHDRYPLTLAVPAKFGLSLNDYYEGPDDSDGFGYFDLGGILSVPLAFMNGKTTWEIHGGVDILWLGDNMKALNGGDGVKAVGVIGFSMIY